MNLVPGKRFLSIDIVRNFGALLLLPLFFILHGYNENFALIAAGLLLKQFFYYALLTVGIAVMSYLLFRSIANAFVYAVYLLGVFFFFGAIHDGLKTLAGDGKLSSYSFVLPFLFFVSVLLFFLLRRESPLLKKVAIFFRLLFVVFVGLEFLFLTIGFATKSYHQNNLIPPLALHHQNTSENPKPDIFFIVFDAYASSKSLKEDIGFDNRELDSMLKLNGFYTADNAKSNYSITPFSLSSTFGMNYLTIRKDGYLVSHKNYLQAVQSFDRNFLVDFLAAEGYTILNYGTHDIRRAPVPTYPFFDDQYVINAIDNQTLYSRVKKDVWWNISTRNLLTGQFTLPANHRKIKSAYLNRNEFNFRKLVAELQLSSDKPRFVYAHLVLPHEPFFLNRFGEEVSDTAIIKQQIVPREGYLEQVQYANRLLKEILPLVARKSDRGKVVVIEGDHGYKFFESGMPRTKVFRNLNSYYFSDQNYSQLYDSISPVNTFRVILNKYFSQSLPLLKDSSFYLVDPEYDDVQE